MVFKRKLYNKLLDWKNKSEGRTALLVEGARRVGKSTIVEEFAKNEYSNYILVDFSKASNAVISLFDDISDLNYIFLQLQIIYKTTLKERASLIIFDEVQFCPRARQAIKHLVKDHRYDYIETGSLVSIQKNTKDILIPSEEESITMYPMDYEEFLWAQGDNTTFTILKEVFEKKQSLGDETNRVIMRKFRLYMLVGGMPQAVETYLRTNSFEDVDRVKRSILKLYEDDFNKIDPSGRAKLLFKYIPSQLSTNASRYQISSVLENGRAKGSLTLISEMADSKTILVSHHANDPNIGLANNMDIEKFKIFLTDTGLFITLVFMDKEFTENDIYEKLLSDKLPANLGYVYENMVAQIMATKGNELFYYTWMNERSRHNYEVDFLLSRKSKIIPIEVKSSGYKNHPSLDNFCVKFSSRISDRYLVYTKDLRKEEQLICIPIYMAYFL